MLNALRFFFNYSKMMLKTRPLFPTPWAVAWLFVTAVACGCSGNGTPGDLTPVAGLVSLDGKPLAEATVTFYASDPAVAPGYSASVGKTDAEGKYQLISRGNPGTLPGAFKVTISKFVSSDGAALKPEEGMDMQQLAMQGLAKESVPAKYSALDRTELTATVEPGKSEGYNFDLKGS